jgi:hypothetical protein
VKKPTYHTFTRAAAIAMLLSLAAACQDSSTGPTLEEVDPEGMAASIGDVVGSLTGNEELQTYNQLSDYIGMALGGGALPTFDFTEGQELQQGLSTLSRRLASCALNEPTSALAGPIIDSQLAGTVFIWGGDGYIPGDEPNPFDEGVDGVRFILYTIEVPGGPVVELPIGYVDFIDESVEGGGNTLRVIVAPTEGSPVVNYAVTCELSGFALQVAGSGFITDGITQINLDLSLSIAQSGAFDMDFTLDVPSEDVEIRFLAQADSFDAFDEGGTFNATFSISRNNSVRFGLNAVDNALDGIVQFCDASNNCSTVALISGTLDSPVITDSEGNALGQDAITALVTLFEAAGAFVENLFPMLAPAFEICFPLT